MKFAGKLFESFRNYYTFGRMPLLRYAGIVGAVGYPLFYLIYIYVLHQPYESLSVRLIATVGCIGLGLQKQWPAKAKPYYLAFAYWVILYCLPFFHIFLTLKNHGGMIMIADSFMAVFFLVLLTDWRNTLMMILIALVLATAIYVASTPNPSVPMDYVQRLPTFILVIVGGSLFKFSERQIAQKLEEEKLHGMSAVLGTIAHEIRTPLGSISAGARGLQRYVPMLMQFYHKHKDSVANAEGLPSQVERVKLEMTLPTIDRIFDECKHINSIIDLLLANAIDKGKSQTIQHFDVANAVQRALDFYPFEDAKRRSLIQMDFAYKFSIEGNEELFKMVLVNLIKNSLTAIGFARKGSIVVRTEAGPQGGRLIVRDTGSGIPSHQLPHIFKRFHSYPPNSGTGIGLAFCHDMLANWGAQISCSSEEGVFTEFVITFPPQITDMQGQPDASGSAAQVQK